MSHPGYYVKPTVLVSVKPNMKVVRGEIFIGREHGCAVPDLYTELKSFCMLI